MHASEVTPEVVARANELYWSSERSVNQIAEDLDLSKGALYGILAPLPSGLGCPLCGDEVTWANRTAKDRDRLDCPTCDWDGSADETGVYEPAEGSEDGPGVDGDEPAEDEAQTLDGAGSDLPVPVPTAPATRTRLSTIAGGALIGAAVGLALVLWARRR